MHQYCKNVRRRLADVLRQRDIDYRWQALLQRHGWEVDASDPEAKHFSFSLSKGDQRLLIRTRAVVGTHGRIHLSQRKFPPNNAWAVALYWKPREGTEHWLLIPGTQWASPQPPFHEYLNISAARDAEWVLNLDPKHEPVLQQFDFERGPQTATWAGDASDRNVLLSMIAARPDIWERRDPRKPAFLPPSWKPKGAADRETWSRGFNKKLLRAFEKYLEDTDEEATAVIEGYMAWLIGVDTFDSDYQTPEGQAEVNRRIKAGHTVPRYYKTSRHPPLGPRRVLGSPPPGAGRKPSK